MDWINTWELPEIERLKSAHNIVLFGAGNGSCELLEHLRKHGIADRVTAVADNDRSLHGKQLFDLPIIDPATLRPGETELVLVTTVSGREAVARQLGDIGFTEGRDFFCAGVFPTNAGECIRWLLDLHTATGLLDVLAGSGTRAVHVGPGGFLGVECALVALGAGRVDAVDAFSFAMDYPDVTARRSQYEQARTVLLDGLATLAGHDHTATAARWDALFEQRDDTLWLNASSITLHHPHRFSALPLPDACAGLVCSYAVLEHVRHAQRAVAECLRTLAPGGMAVHRILTRDHRSYGRVSGHTPFSFREHSKAEWEHAVGDGFWQNRVAPWQWRELFEQAGLEVVSYRVLERMAISPDQRQRLHPDFAGWADDARGTELDCDIVVRKG